MAVIKDGKNYFGLKITKNNRAPLKGNDKEKKIPIPTPQEELIVKNKQENNLLKQVKEYIKDKETLSVSRLQSEFCIGYPKAKIIMQILIQEGLIENPEEFKYIVKK